MEKKFKFSNYSNIAKVIALILVMILFVLLFMNSGKGNVKSANSVYKEIKINNFSFTNGMITHENGLYTYTVDMKNTSKKAIFVKDVNIIFYDKNKKEIATLIGYVDKKIKSNKVEKITASVDLNIKKYSSIEIKVNN